MSEDPGRLAAAVLDAEAERIAEQAEREERVLLPDDLLPGVDEEPMTLAEAGRANGWKMVVLLFLLNVVDEFPRTIRVVAPDIQDSLGLSDVALQAVLSFGGVALVLGAVPLASLADKVRRVAIIPIASVLWAATTALSGLVANGFQLFVANFATGAGQAYRIPVSNSLLTDTYPIGARARIFAAESLGRPIGQLLGPLVVGGIAAAFGDEGWRWAYVGVAIPGVLVGLACMSLDEPERGAFEQEAVLGGTLTAAADELPVTISSAFNRLKKVRTFYFLCVGIGTLGFALVAVPVQLNLLLDDAYGFGPFERGLIESVMWVGALVTVPIAGRVFDERFREDPPSMLRLSGALVAAGGIATLIALRLQPAPLVIIGMTMAQALYSAAFVAAPATIAAVAPYRMRAQAFALLPVFVFLMGGFFGGLLVGTISDAWGERAAMSLVAPPAALIGGGLIAYGSRFMRGDIALTVEELLEEQAENERMRDQPDDIPLLQLRNVDAGYGKVQVLFDVECEVAEGEVLALLGTNGAGKSTVLRAISGLNHPDRGVIRLDGQTITFTEAELRVELGIVQVAGGKATFGPLSVDENLRVAAFTQRKDPDRVAERIEYVYGLFPDLANRKDQAAGSMSGGQQQQLAIAKALVLEPRILLIDELSLGLAPLVVQELLKVVEQLRADGLTMIIVEQSLNVALSIADRAVFMEKGQVRFTGPADELLERDDLVRAVFLGTEGG